MNTIRQIHGGINIRSISDVLTKRYKTSRQRVLITDKTQLQKEFTQNKVKYLTSQTTCRRKPKAKESNAGKTYRSKQTAVDSKKVSMNTEC